MQYIVVVHYYGGHESHIAYKGDDKTLARIEYDRQVEKHSEWREPPHITLYAVLAEANT